MIQAILFDLEKTLTNVDNAEFTNNYHGILAPRFAHLLSPDKFIKQLLRSIEVTQSEPKLGQTNMQTFFDDFCKATGQSTQTLKPIFEKFYTSDFPTLQCLVKINHLGVKVVEYAIQQGFLTAAVSKPIMPLNAMQEQVRWAGFVPEHFKVISALDNLHYCKPHIEFYREIADTLRVTPESCLLVTKNPQDLVCRELGMKIFFVGEVDSEIQADYMGQLDDLLRYISLGSL